MFFWHMKTVETHWTWDHGFFNLCIFLYIHHHSFFLFNILNNILHDFALFYKMTIWRLKTIALCFNVLTKIFLFLYDTIANTCKTYLELCVSCVQVVHRGICLPFFTLVHMFLRHARTRGADSRPFLIHKLFISQRQKGNVRSERSCILQQLHNCTLNAW